MCRGRPLGRRSKPRFSRVDKQKSPRVRGQQKERSRIQRMANFGRRSKKRRAEARHLHKRRASEPERPENKNAPTESGRKSLQAKYTATAVSCQVKPAEKKQNRRKPVDCKGIAEVTLDFSFSKEKISTQDPPSKPEDGAPTA